MLLNLIPAHENPLELLVCCDYNGWSIFVLLLITNANVAAKTLILFPEVQLIHFGCCVLYVV
jgi:hypothetical protein